MRRALRIGLLAAGPLLILAGVGVIVLGLARFIGELNLQGVAPGGPALAPGESPGTRTQPPSMPSMGELWPVYIGIGLIACGYVAIYISRTRRLTAGPPVPTEIVTARPAGAGEPLDLARGREPVEGPPGAVQPAEEAPGAAVCPKCGVLNRSEARFCSVCGAALPTSYRCQACGQVNQPGSEFCDNCGWHL